MSKQVLKIGVAHQESGPISWIGDAVQATAGMWKRHLRESGALDEVGVEVEFVFMDTESNSVMAAEVTRKLIEEEKVDIVICPGSVECEACAMVAENYDIVAIGVACAIVTSCPSSKGQLDKFPPCKNPFERRFKNLRVMHSPITSYFDDAIRAVGLLGGKSIAFVGFDPFLSLENTGLDLLRSFAEDAGLENLLEINLPNSPENQYNLGSLVDHNLSKLDPDMVIMLPPNDQACIDIVTIFKSKNYLPRALTLINCLSFSTFEPALRNDASFLVTPFQWHKRLSGTDYRELEGMQWSMFKEVGKNSITSAMQFENAYLAETNKSAHYLSATAMASWAYIEAGIRTLPNQESSALSFRTISDCLNTVQQPSFFGPLFTSSKGTNDLKPIALIQAIPDDFYRMEADFPSQNIYLDSYTNRIISPLDSAESGFVYPMPHWSERVHVSQIFQTPEEQIIVVMSLVASLLLVLSALAIYWNREIPQIRYASMPFTLCTTLSPIILFAGVLCTGLEEGLVMCSLKHWFFTLGPLLFIAPILAKTYRIRLIDRNSRHLRFVKVTNRDVGRWILVLVVPQIVLNIIWSVVVQPQPQMVVVDLLRPVNNFNSCPMDTVYLVISSTYIGILYLLSLAAALESRKFWKEFNEAKALSNAMFIILVGIVFIGCIGVSNDRKAVYLGRSIGIIVTMLGATATLLAYQLIKVSTRSIKNLRSSNTSGSNEPQENNTQYTESFPLRDAESCQIPGCTNCKVNPASVCAACYNNQCHLKPKGSMSSSEPKDDNWGTSSSTCDDTIVSVPQEERRSENQVDLTVV